MAKTDKVVKNKASKASLPGKPISSKDILAGNFDSSKVCYEYATRQAMYSHFL
jgi:hypothetical protein